MRFALLSSFGSSFNVLIITERADQKNVFLLQLWLFFCDVDAVDGAVDGNTGPDDALRKFVRSDVRLGREGEDVAFFLVQLM
jgi:hypothetical protein